MGKKKGKKGGQYGDVANDDVNLDDLVNEIENNAPAPPAKKAAKKKKQKQDDDWENDVLNEIAELGIGDKAQKKEGTENDEKTTNTPNEKTNENKQNANTDFFVPSDDEGKKKKGKKGKNVKQEKFNETATEDAENAEMGDDEPIVTIKTKAQKLAEKKERERKKKEQQKLQKQKQSSNQANTESAKTQNEEYTTQKSEEKLDAGDENEETEKTTSKKKKDKKKKKGDAAEKTEKKKKPNKAMVKAMQEELQRRKEEEERLQREEDERLKKEAEAEEARLKKIEEEKEKKERKKQKEKERKIRLKEEGKWMTAKQKEEARRNAAYIESLRERGLIPTKDASEKPKRPRYDNRKKKRPVKTEEEASVKDETVEEEQKVEVKQEEEFVEIRKEDIKMDEEETKEDDDDDDAFDNWEDLADESDIDEPATKTKTVVEKGKEEETKPQSDDDAESESDSDEEESSDDDEEESEEESEDDTDLSPRERAINRIEKRKEANESKRSVDELRCPVICVMGHVDTGKTKILDKIRRSNVQDGEAGGITQQIGATNVPEDAIRRQTSMVKSFQDFEMRFPGLLVIDTPGHESFSNLRSRGSSVCDMAILVVDIMHGLEPQTIESIKMLKKRKTPFIVALNKIDRLYEWKRGPDSDIVNTIKKQKRHTKDEFDEHVRNIIVQFAEQELNVKLFYENDDPLEWISMVPTSAHSGDGMGNLMALLCKICQETLAKRLAFSEELSCTVLEVKAIQGLGTTVDVILTNGYLNYGDKIVLAGVEGPIVTHVKALLMPQPLKELRVKNPYDKFDKLKAAQGVKILAKDLDRALAGTQLLVAHNDDEVDILKEEVQAEVEKTLKSIRLQERGVFVQASTLGSLEALLVFLKQSKIPYAGINIGPVHKKDIMKASVMLEHDSQWAVILAFDVKVEREAQELADHLGVTIFTADIIYHLFDKFTQHREDLKKQKQDEFRSIAVFPCKLKIVPNCVFKSRDPIIIGVNIESGQLRSGTPICVPDKEFCFLGRVASIEFNHKAIEIAKAGQEVCIKVEGVPGEAPKMVGRHFEETDVLVSKINRDSIDALKDWFRDEMQKSDWQLIIELKKLFEIM